MSTNQEDGMASGYPKKVRVSMFPHTSIEVGEAEYLDLSRQGLLLPDTEKNTVSTDKSEKGN